MEHPKVESKIFNGPDCYNWREIYAWLPVKKIDGNYAWLRPVYKRRYWAVWGPRAFHMEPVVEYADVFDLLRGLDD